MLKKINNNIKKDENYKTNWKAESEKYLLELEKFLDKAESIKDQKLRREIIIQMLKCDKELTLVAERNFEKKYKMGIIKGKTTNN